MATKRPPLGADPGEYVISKAAARSARIALTDNNNRPYAESSFILPPPMGPPHFGWRRFFLAMLVGLLAGCATGALLSWAF